jgi:hypothetical protein
MVCYTCGTSNPDRATFCSRCGKPLGQPAPQPMAPQFAAPAAPQPPVAAPVAWPTVQPPVANPWAPPAVPQASRSTAAGLNVIFFFLLIANPAWSSFVFLKNATAGAWGNMFTLFTHEPAFSNGWITAISFTFFSALNMSAMIWGVAVGRCLRNMRPRSLSAAKLYFIVGVLGVNGLSILTSAAYFIQLAERGQGALIIEPIFVFGSYIAMGIFGLTYLNSSSQVAAAYPMG